ncbi:MAG: hypothetical protein HQK97_04340 [Nitrospirae bacterium]|nr:hypothetical protein [Nitrospirota bacterium]
MKKKEPVPGVYFNVRQVSGNSEDKMKESNGAEYKLVIGVLEQLRGRPLRNEVSSRLRKCFEALPKASTVDHAGIMLSRNQNVARMVLTIDKETLQDYLVEIEYPGSIQEVLELTAEFGQFANIRYIIDVSDTVLPKIGMECLVLNDNGDNKSVWERLLGYLVARSLCIPQKMDALLSWPGHASALLASDLWPSYIIRRISHIKIVCQNKGPLEAKGYLQFHRKFTIELINALESAENGR